jgi:hypothetical protein
MTDHRKTAQIWTGFFYLALRDGMRTNHRESDLDFAFIINEANALHLAARVACEQAGIEFSELREAMRDFFDKRSVKIAREYFAKERKRWEKSTPPRRRKVQKMPSSCPPAGVPSPGHVE